MVPGWRHDYIGFLAFQNRKPNFRSIDQDSLWIGAQRNEAPTWRGISDFESFEAGFAVKEFTGDRDETEFRLC